MTIQQLWKSGSLGQGNVRGTPLSRLLRLLVAGSLVVGVVGLLPSTAEAASFGPYLTTANPSLNERSAPSTSASIVGTLPYHSSIYISCQTTGSSVNGSNIWDRLSNSYFVSDYWVSTPNYATWSPPIPQCNNTLTLTSGQSVSSPNGGFTLKMQDDGNLVVYLNPSIYGTSQPLWNSGTYNHQGAYAVMQAGGNLIVYSSSGIPLWSSGTSNHPGAYLSLRNDGNLVIGSSSGSTLWQTNTSGTTKTSLWNCTTRVDAAGNPVWRVCLRTTVWHNSVHAGVLSIHDVVESCASTTGWACPTGEGATEKSVNGPWTGGYLQGSFWKSGANTDWLNAEIIWNDPVDSPPLASWGYCVYIRINTRPDGTFQYPGPVVNRIGPPSAWAWYEPPPPCPS